MNSYSIASERVQRGKEGIDLSLAAFFFSLPFQVILPFGQIEYLLTSDRTPVPFSAISTIVCFSLYYFGNKQINAGVVKNPFSTLLPMILAYMIFSAILGQYRLSGINRDTLPLITGYIDYYNAAAQRIIQFIICIFAFEFVRSHGKDGAYLLKIWMYGCFAGAVTHLFIFVKAGDDLVGRAGPFVEGNFGGLYYLISIFIGLELFRRERSRASIFLSGSAIVGFFLARSSIGFLALAIGLYVRYAFQLREKKVSITKQIFILFAILSVFGFLFKTGNDFGLSNKLLTEEITSESYSRIDRLTLIDTAYNIFLTSPIFGTGIQSFGFIANDYLDSSTAIYYDWTFRRIPNNIYFEFASEMGVIGLSMLLFFILKIARLAKSSLQDDKRNLFGALVAVFFYWLAFPTYSLIFAWAFFGLVCHEAQRLPDTQRAE